MKKRSLRTAALASALASLAILSGAGSAATIPQSLANLGEYGENIYDASKANKWTEAQAKFAALKAAIEQSAAELGKAEHNRTDLQAAVTALDRAIGKREQAAAMRAANQVTLVASELSAPYHPKVPADVARLDYNGRELEIWSRLSDTSKLKATAQDMRRTWDRLEPEVKSHNGAAEARKFGALIARTDRAQSVAEYQRLALPVLDEVDNLEKVFEKFGK